MKDCHVPWLHKLRFFLKIPSCPSPCCAPGLVPPCRTTSPGPLQECPHFREQAKLALCPRERRQFSLYPSLRGGSPELTSGQRVEFLPGRLMVATPIPFRSYALWAHKNVFWPYDPQKTIQESNLNRGPVSCQWALGIKWKSNQDM